MYRLSQSLKRKPDPTGDRTRSDQTDREREEARESKAISVEGLGVNVLALEWLTDECLKASRETKSKYKIAEYLLVPYTPLRMSSYYGNASNQDVSSLPLSPK